MTILPWVVALIQVLGILSAVRAVMDARTPQGAIAWAIALVAFPYLALPLFWIFGKRKFVGYVIERRSALSEASPIAKRARQLLAERGLLVTTAHARQLPFERLAKLPFTTVNEVELLVNGEATFASRGPGLDRARLPAAGPHPHRRMDAPFDGFSRPSAILEPDQARERD